MIFIEVEQRVINVWQGQASSRIQNRKSGGSPSADINAAWMPGEVASGN